MAGTKNLLRVRRPARAESDSGQGSDFIGKDIYIYIILFIYINIRVRLLGLDCIQSQ